MPLGDSSLTPSSSRSRRCPHDEGEEAKAVERISVERRRCWLTKLPRMYTPGHRERYLFLNLDNIASALLMSKVLYQHVNGAASSRDILLNFAALTNHLSGNSPTTAVKVQLATYCKTSPFVAQSLKKFGWTLKLVASGDKALYTKLTEQLGKGAVNTNGKTLVLVTGGGYLGTANANAYREIVCKFLKQGWYVEIHAWLYALNDGYLRLQKENPGRVVVKPLDDVVDTLARLNGRGHGHQGETTSESNRREIHWGGDRRSTQERATTSASTGVSAPRELIQVPGTAFSWSTPAASPPNQVSAATTLSCSAVSWAQMVKEGRMIRSTTSTESSSPESAAAGFGELSQLPHRWPQATLTPPLPPALPSPLSTLRASSMHSELMWSLQMEQMQDLLSSQQADLSMRQTVLQRTTELMRAMREQGERVLPGESYRHASEAHNPWTPGAGRF